MRFTVEEQNTGAWAVVYNGTIIRQFYDPRQADALAFNLNENYKGIDIADKDDANRLISYLNSIIVVEYFPSALGAIAELEGFTNANQNLGVTLSRVSPDKISFISSTVARWLMVGPRNEYQLLFADSGAFTEVDGETLEVINPIDYDTWRLILGSYIALANKWGNKLYPVAPDRLGDATYSHKLFDTHADLLKKIDKLNANMIIPIQGSPKTILSDFDKIVKMVKKHGIKNWILGFPATRKSPYKLEHLEELLSNRLFDLNGIHILGKSPNAHDWQHWADLIASYNAQYRRKANGWNDLKISADATRLPAVVGRQRSSLAPLTKIEDDLREVVGENAWNVYRDEMMQNLEYDDTLMIDNIYVLDDHPDVYEAMIDEWIANKTLEKGKHPPKSWLMDSENLELWLRTDAYANFPEDVKLSKAEKANLKKLKPTSKAYWDLLIKAYDRQDNDIQSYWGSARYGKGGNELVKAYQIAIFRETYEDASVKPLSIPLLTPRQRGVGSLAVNPKRRL